MRRREGKEHHRHSGISDNSGKRDYSEERDDRGVSVSKARGVIGLIAMLFVFQCVTFIIHKCDGPADGVKSISDGTGSDKTGIRKTNPGREELDINGFFDPNTVSAESLAIFGLTERQARAIIRYREKGGKFRRAEDFGRMYVIDDVLFKRLAPHIRIAEQRKEDYLSGRNPSGQTRSGRMQAAGTQTAERFPVKKGEASRPDSAAEPSANTERNAPLKERQQEERRQEYGQERQQKEKQQRERQRAAGPDAVDLNEADSSALVAIRGIGPYFASAILRLRARLGTYASVEQLAEVRGMTPERLAPLRRYLFVHPGGIKKFSIASADYEFLRRHPYIGPYRARGIALFREKYGEKECSLENLVANSILDMETAEKLAPYIEEQEEREEQGEQ